MAHYDLEPTTNNLGVAHENGDVEQEHFRFKEAVDQALRVRGSRDFADRGTYDRLLQQLVSQRNLTLQARWDLERQALRPLPMTSLLACREVRVPVSRFSTIRVLQNTYSVPSRLIGTLRAWMDRFAEYVAAKRGMAETLRAVIGAGQIMSPERGMDSSARSARCSRRVAAGSLRSDVGAEDVLASLTDIFLATSGPDQRAQAGLLLELLMDALRRSR